MPLFGELELDTVAPALPRLRDLDTEAWEIPKAEIVQLAYEVADGTRTLLPQLRRQATGPDSGEQAGEGLCLGGPARVMHALKRWESVGVDRVNFLVNTAEMIPQAEVLASLRLFGREVMPAFNGTKG